MSFWRRPNHPVLNNISCAFSKGDVVVIVGETGCGKSTFASLCCGLYPASSGAIYINGKNIQSCIADTRTRIGIVFQEPSLFIGSVYENVVLDRTETTEDDFAAALDTACATEFVEALPRNRRYNVGTAGQGLSSGQRQRIAIARAVLQKPDILILDEGTSNLDADTEIAILSKLLAARKNRITILITHRMSTALVADRVIVMSNGEIIETGTPTELLACPSRFGSLCEAQRTSNPESTEVGSAQREFAVGSI